MRPTRSHKSHITVLLWLSLSQSVLGTEETGSFARRSFVDADRYLHTLSKRAASSKTTYIAVVVGVVGTLAIVSAGVCWDLHRRRSISRQRQMEEARHPREPISYDHFPVESQPGAETGSPRVAINASGINSSPAMTMPVASHLAPLTIQGGSRLTAPPGLEVASPPIAHPRASHPRDHLTSQSTHPEGLSSSQRSPRSGGQPRLPESTTDAPQYEEDAGLQPPPPFFDGGDAALHHSPPGLEGPNGRVHSNPNSTSSSRPSPLLTPPPSRPPTASAPPAYTPSDSEAHNTSPNNSARSTPPQ